MDKATENSEKTKRKENPSPPDDRKYNAYVRYSGIAFQTMALILLGVFGGYKIDRHFEHEQNWVTAITTLLATAFALYYLFKQLTQQR